MRRTATVGRRWPGVTAFMPLIRVCAMLLQIAITIALLGLAAMPAALVERAVLIRYGILGAAVVLPLAYAIWGIGFCALVILAKRLVFPVTPVGTFPFHSSVVVRWAFVTQLAKVAHQMFITWVIGTDLVAWWFALLGARIGRRVTINTTFIYDWDLLEIGDDTFIGGRSTVMAHIGQGGRVAFAPTTLGAKCTVGQGCCVFCGVVMENKVTLGANSVVLRNERLVGNRMYLGVPAQLLGGAPASRIPARDQTGGDTPSAPGTSIRLDRNENQFPLSDAVLRSLHTITAETITSYARGDALGGRLSDWLQVERHRIALGVGAEGVLKNAFHTLVRPDDGVLLPSDPWSYYEELVRDTDGRPSYYPLQDGADAFRTCPNAVVQCARDADARLVVLASPNNPTGHSLSLSEVRTVLDAMPDVAFILDEAYWGYGARSNAHVPELIATYPNLLIVRSFSKFFGMPGLRVGVGVAGSALDPIVRRCGTYLGHNRLAEALAVAALDDLRHFDAIAATVIDERDRLTHALNAIDGVQCYRSDASFVLVRLREDLAGAFRAHAEQRGLFVRYLAGGALERSVRITVGTPEQNREVLRTFQQAREAVA